MRDRIDRITRRVASCEVVAVSFFFSKARPNDLFGGLFFDLREKAKGLKEKWSQEAAVKLEKALSADLRGKGMTVSELKLSLGQYRGSRFVTSAKLRVKLKNEKQADELLTYLRGKYSPKYKLKSFDDKTGEAFFNIR
jgi:hypothetical protein